MNCVVMGLCNPVEKIILIDLIHSFILAWLEGKLKEVKSMFCENFVFNSSQESRHIKGVKKFYGYLEDKLKNKKVIRYNEEDFAVYIHNSSAVINYRFLFEYEMNDKKEIENGCDFYLLQKEDAGCKLKCRSVLYFR